MSSVELKQVPSVPELYAGRDGAIFRRVDGSFVQLPQRLSGGGYMKVSLRQKRRYVHRLVLEAFKGPPLDGQVACHWNDIKTDNRIENLRWGSRAENAADAARNNRLPHGEKNHHTKIPEDQISVIRERVRNGEVQRHLAKEYGVAPCIICGIVNGRGRKSLREATL